MTLKYDKNTKLIGGFSIDIVDETDPVWSYMLRHNMLDENIDWVTEDVITDLLEKPKVKLPKSVAEYLEKCKEEGLRLWLAIDIEDCQGDIFPYLLTNMETFARAWLDGYEVEQEKLYVVTDGNKLYLKEFNELNAIIIIDDVVGAIDYAKRYEDKTKAQQAADKLGWVVKEVEG